MEVLLIALIPYARPWSATISMQFFVGCIQLLTKNANLHLSPIGYQRLDRAMQGGVETFLNKTETDAVLLMRHTEKLPDWGLQRLIERDKPIVGAVSWEGDTLGARVYQKADDMMLSIGGEVGQYLAQHEFEDRAGPLLLPGDEEALLPCDAVGVGALLIRREAFSVIEAPWFSYEMGGEFPEFQFCHQALGAGVQPYCDMSVICESDGYNHLDFLKRYGKRVD